MQFLERLENTPFNPTMQWVEISNLQWVEILRNNTLKFQNKQTQKQTKQTIAYLGKNYSSNDFD